ncbi:MAG TPA: DUF1573 domain-containing protein [Gemmatimonadales bacterium]|nr:DUF1573 domain-containing protein [Gemmatimonadales bacterium]
MRDRCSTLLMLIVAGSFSPLINAEPPVPRGMVANDTYDFGSVRQGAPVSHAFIIKNAGEGPLRITGAKLSMPGMRVRVASVEIPAQGEGAVTVELNTERVVGAIEGEAQIQWNDPTRSGTSLTLKGYVVPRIAIEPIPAVFLSAFTAEPAERTLTIRNNESQPLAITSVEHSARLSVSVAEVEPGKVFILTARSVNGVPAGRYEESLTLVTDKPGADRINLPVHLWVKPDLYANPENVDFGTLRVDEVQRSDVTAFLTQTFFLKRRGDPFRITAIACDSSAVDVTQSPAGPSNSFQIDVRLRPEGLRRGNLDGKIRIMTTDPRFPEVVISLSGTLI